MSIFSPKSVKFENIWVETNCSIAKSQVATQPLKKLFSNVHHESWRLTCSIHGNPEPLSVDSACTGTSDWTEKEHFLNSHTIKEFLKGEQKNLQIKYSKRKFNLTSHFYV